MAVVDLHAGVAVEVLFSPCFFTPSRVHLRHQQGIDR